MIAFPFISLNMTNDYFGLRLAIWTCLFYLMSDFFQTVIKDAMPVSFRSELFTLYILTIFKQRNRKFEKLPYIIVIHACQNIREKMYVLKMSGPQIWLCLFTFRPIASKQLNGLTTIDTLS